MQRDTEISRTRPEGGREAPTPKGMSRPPSPPINESEFLSAVTLVFEKEGYVTNKLVHRHFFPGYDTSVTSRRLKRLEREGVLVEKGPFFGGRGAERVYIFATPPGNGNGSGQGGPAVTLPPLRLQAKAPPEPPGDLQPYSEIRILISRAIERLEEFKERYEEFQESYQPLLAALLDMEKDMAAFEKLVEVLGGVRALAMAGLKEVRRDLDFAG